MDPYSIILYCLDNFSNVDPVDSHDGTTIYFDRGEGKRSFFINIKEFDTPDDNSSNLDRDGIFRITIRLSKKSYDDLFGTQANNKYVQSKGCDYKQVNKIMPHKTLSKEYYIICLSPSNDLFNSILKYLIADGYRESRRLYLSGGQ